MHSVSSDSRVKALRALLAENKKLAIVGGPDTGKTELAGLVTDRPVIHTDDWLDMLFANVPDAVIEECEKHESFVLEGNIQAARCLRRGLAIDAVIFLDDVHGDEPRPSMTKATEKVFDDWRRNNRVTRFASGA